MIEVEAERTIGLFRNCAPRHPEASYGASYFGGRKDSYDVVKVGTPRGRRRVIATDGNLDAWRRLWQQAMSGLEGNRAFFRAQGRNEDGS